MTFNFTFGISIIVLTTTTKNKNNVTSHDKSTFAKIHSFCPQNRNGPVDDKAILDIICTYQYSIVFYILWFTGI